MRKPIIGFISEPSTCIRREMLLGLLSTLTHIPICDLTPTIDPQTKYGYPEAGFLAGIALATGFCQLVIGGCGTGVGFALAANSMPGVNAAVIRDSTEAVLFSRINAGNCISLPLAYGYGWGAEINIKNILKAVLQDTAYGDGYPDERRQPQEEGRARLAQLQTISKFAPTEMLQRIGPSWRSILAKCTWLPEAIGTADDDIRRALETNFSADNRAPTHT